MQVGFFLATLGSSFFIYFFSLRFKSFLLHLEKIFLSQQIIQAKEKSLK